MICMDWWGYCILTGIFVVIAILYGMYMGKVGFNEGREYEQRRR